jgi:predicted component of type VI protein secretion system
MGKLVHFDANGASREIKLDRERITIGRRPDNDVCLPQPPVSGAHAAVVTILADSFLEDLGSTNGTLVNGKAVTKHFLRDGDEIDIGREILVYLVDDSAKLDAPPQGFVRAQDSAVAKAGESGVSPDAGVPGDADGVQRGKRRSDGPAANGGPVDTVQRLAATGVEGAPSEVAASGPETSGADAESTRVDRSAETLPTIKVLSGSGTGRVVSLAKSETLIGRAGVQVASLQRTADEIRVVPIEGASPPSVNGAPVAPEGRRLTTGDILEIAGARLELVIPAAEGA